MIHIRNELVPEKVRVAFVTTMDGDPVETPYTIEVTLASLTLPEYSDDVGQLGAVKTVHMERVATITTASSPDPTNLTELTDLATQWAKDWYLWKIRALLDASFAGIYNWTLDGYHDVSWDLKSDPCEDGTTRVVRGEPGIADSEPIHNGHPVTSGGSGALVVDDAVTTCATTDHITFDNTTGLKVDPASTASHATIKTISAAVAQQGTVDLAAQVLGNHGKTVSGNLLVYPKYSGTDHYDAPGDGGIIGGGGNAIDAVGWIATVALTGGGSNDHGFVLVGEAGSPVSNLTQSYIRHQPGPWSISNEAAIKDGSITLDTTGYLALSGSDFAHAEGQASWDGYWFTIEGIRTRTDTSTTTGKPAYRCQDWDYGITPATMRTGIFTTDAIGNKYAGGIIWQRGGQGSDTPITGDTTIVINQFITSITNVTGPWNITFDITGLLVGDIFQIVNNGVANFILPGGIILAPGAVAVFQVVNIGGVLVAVMIGGGAAGVGAFYQMIQWAGVDQNQRLKLNLRDYVYAADQQLTVVKVIDQGANNRTTAQFQAYGLLQRGGVDLIQRFICDFQGPGVRFMGDTGTATPFWFGYNIEAIQTADFNATTSYDALYRVDISGGNVTCSLEAASAHPGKKLAFKITTAGNTLTINRNGADTILNQVSVTSLSLTDLGQWVVLVSDGVNQWEVVSRSYRGGTPVNPSVNLVGAAGTSDDFLRSDAILILDQGIAPTWTATHTWDDGTAVQYEAIGITRTSPIATGQRDSPWVRWSGTSYDTGAHRADWTQSVDMTSNAGASRFVWNYQLDAGGYAALMTLDSLGTLTVNALELPDTSLPTAPATCVILYSFDQQGFSVPHYTDDTAAEIELSRDNLVICKNTSGGALTKGTVVYVTGATGTVPNIAKAKADSTSTLPALGILFENTANNAFGRVVVLGDLEHYDTSSFAAGDILYVSATTAGALTNTPPAAPNYIQNVGTVLASSVGAGAIFVSAKIHRRDMALQSSTAVAITGGTIAGLTHLAVRDTSAAFDLVVAATSTTALTAERTLTIDVDNANRTLKFTADATIGGTTSGGANPTATIGLSAVNGSATSFIRSDGAPALSQAIAPTWTAAHAWKLTDAATNTVTTILTIGHDTSGTAAAGFGESIAFQLQDSTTADQDVGNITWTWATATHASRKGRGVINVYDTAVREALRVEASGTAPMIGFLGASASAALASPDLGTLATTFGLATGTPTFTEANLTFTDITTNNASTSSHGFLKKLNNDATTYMDGTGNYSTPASSGGVGTILEANLTGNQGTTNATLTAVTGLSVSISASKKYVGRIFLNVTGNPTAGSRFGVSGPASPTRVYFGAIGTTTATTAFATGNSTTFATAGGTSGEIGQTFNTASIGKVDIDVLIDNGSTAGTVQVLQRSITNGQTTQCGTGSTIWLVQVT